MNGEQTLPTIVLIGGQLTLADGSQMDSRQSAADEKTARALAAALTSCAEWWSAVSSIVVPTLDDCGEGGFAVIFGRRSIVRTTLDGEVRRSGLGKLLRGAVGSVSAIRSGINQSLPTDYQSLAHLCGLPEGSDMGSVGVRFDDPMPRWCFVNRGEYYLRRVANRIGARVIIDTTGGLPSIDYCAPSAYPHLVVVPDTARMRFLIGDPLTRRPQNIPFSETPSYMPGVPRDPADFLRFPVARAECGVTALLQMGQLGDAAGLEAARMLLLKRFDLKLGLWDLALNPVLRSTVLDSMPIRDVPEEEVQPPAFAWKQAERKAEEATERREAERRAVNEFNAAFHRQLASVGWILNDKGSLDLPLTEPLRTGAEAGPLVFLRIEVNRSRVCVRVCHQFQNDLDISDFIERRREAFEAVAPLPRSASVLLWTANIGWGDADADWSTTVKSIADHTKQWMGLLADFVCSCREARHAKYDWVQSDGRRPWRAPRIAPCRVRRETAATDRDQSDRFIAANDAVKIQELRDARRRRIVAKIEELSADYDNSTSVRRMMLRIAAKHLDAAENDHRAVTRVRSANAALRYLARTPRRDRQQQ